MNFFRNISLRIKILFPPVIIITGSVLTLLILSLYYLNSQIEGELVRIAEEKVKSIKSGLKQICNQDKELAAFIASQPNIQEAYESYYSDTIGIENSAAQLERTFDRMNKHISKIYKVNLKVHFHLPPATSFYRSWISQRGDELSFIRKSVIAVTKSHQPVAGIEIGKTGIAIRSVVPIISLKNRKYLGSLEVISPLRNLWTLNQIREEEEFGFFVHEKIFNQVKDKMFEKPDSSITLSNFIMMDLPTFKFKIPAIKSALINDFYDSKEKYLLFRSGNLNYVFFKITDFADLPLGIGVYQLNIAKYISDEDKVRAISTIISLVCIIIGILIMLYIANIIINSINQFRNYIDQLSEGKFPEVVIYQGENEVGKMTESINNLVSRLYKIAQFARQMEVGEFKSDFSPLSGKDILGNSLVELRKSLQNAKEEEKRRINEDEKLNWANQGQARFVEIIRESTINLTELADNIIKEVVKYLNANQGGLFIYNDFDPEDKHLELIASYAYDRKKYFSKKIRIGEGLIGECAKDRYTICRHEIPEDYIKIRSGLGEATPRNLLIVPLKQDQYILGVIELASFKIFEKHEIDFIEKIAENIGSSLSNVKINQRTGQLLDQSRKQAEDLEGRELEMRRKVEQMHVERDLAMKSEEKTFGIADSIEHNFIKAEINLDGTIAIANRKFLEVMHYLPPEIEGKHFSMFLEEKDLGRFDTIWARLVSGGNYYEEEVRYITRHSRIWFHVIFTPLRDKLGIINRILFTGFNIDENKTKQITEKAELTAIENSLLKAEYKGDGTIIATNNLYLETIGFSRAETHHQNLFSFIEEDLKPEFSRLWEKVLNGTPSTYLDRIITKKKQEKFFKGVYTSVVDTDGIISKIVYLGLDITEEIENPEKAEVASNQIIDNSKVKEEEIPKKREIKNQKKYQNLFEEDYIDSDEF